MNIWYYIELVNYVQTKCWLVIVVKPRYMWSLQ